jgi:hypothetical protein
MRCRNCKNDLIEVGDSLLYGEYYFCDNCEKIFVLKLHEKKDKDIDEVLCEGRAEEMKEYAKFTKWKDNLSEEDYRLLNN